MTVSSRCLVAVLVQARAGVKPVRAFLMRASAGRRCMVSIRYDKRCERCDQDFVVWDNRAAQSLCPDCRYVLTEWEKREVWAA